ncbi:DNA methylase [Brevibacterium ravenspurgense]|uniref:DNA methylase n=1 Tax=Brevibacterium ravenspurgense TaxID=479117 RepID=A0A150HCD2_9MICO|nr:site-specific DNA-methyltransferase [Brevibacterium ravenspurgense]KXZ59458.1 DNA methylase [Brevibacterium ravenspurgense]
MSRLTELLRQARKADPQLGADLEAEIAALTKRRTFGLVFEQHQPEAVELPGRPVRRGDKVRVLPSRGETKAGDQRLWRVTRVERLDGQRLAHLAELDAEKPETQIMPADDMVVVAEFRDRIYPGLVETGRVERGGDKPFHSVINAENYHALEMLTYTHRHSIDAIYIDPPYNSGAKDWKYNNDYVESDDDYRHSKWLAFMERRLKIARELLNPDDSVLIVTIDDKEINRLSLLLEQTFPEAKIQTICSIINPQGISSGAGEFSRVHEYVLFVYIGDAALTQWSRSMVDNDKEASDVSDDRSVRWADFARYGAKASRQHSPGAFFPIFVNISDEAIHSIGDALDEDQQRDDVPVPEGTRAVWPPNRPDGGDGRWRVTAESCRDLNDNGYLRVGPYNKRSDRHSFAYLQDGAIRKIGTGEIVVTGKDVKGAVTVEYADNTKTATPKTIWTLPSHDASRHGSNLLRQFLPGRSFPFPKSLYAVEDALRFFVADKPDATIIDFFSGSGTTAHAVMRLNRDGGRRRSICVTNNEVSANEQAGLRKNGLRPGDPEWEALGICDYITKPRLTAAITGQTPEGESIKGDYKFTDKFPMSEGFEENAAFFTLTYEAPLSVRHNRAFERVAPMLWLRAGSRGRVIYDLGEDGWDVAESYGVLENLDQADEFVTAVSAREGIDIVFVVTDDDSAFQMVCRELPNEVVPVRLYESYLQNFEINTGRSL